MSKKKKQAPGEPRRLASKGLLNYRLRFGKRWRLEQERRKRRKRSGGRGGVEMADARSTGGQSDGAYL